MVDSLRSKALKGVMWSAIERFSTQGIQFLLSIVIARFVIPSDYGLIAMLGIFLAIAQTFIDSGFSNALIQKKSVTEIDFSTVFYFNIFIAIVIYLFLFGVAPYISLFYGEPQLIATTRWLGLSIVISAFSIVQRAKLTLQLNFKVQAKASLLSIMLSGGIGIYMAYRGCGVWALVVQTLSNNFLNTLFLWKFTHWIPLFAFSWKSFKVLFSFGSKLLLAGLLHTVYVNLYSLVIGKKYSAQDVGFYNRACSFAQFPSVNISSVITRTIYPIQCQFQDDEERLRISFLQYLRIACYVMFPLMIGLAVLAKPLILILLTEKWLFAAKLLAILCCAYLWYPVSIINNHLLNAKGRSDYFFKAEIVKKIVAVVVLVITMPLGIEILCWGLLVYYLFDVCISMFFVKRMMKISLSLQFRNILPILFLALIMGAGVYWVIQFLNNWYLQVGVGLFLGCVIYFGISCLFKIRDFVFLLNIFKERFVFHNRK